MHDNMMKCRCPHHLVDKVLAVLMWIAAILFFWTSWKSTMVWSFGAAYYAWVVVVLGLLVLVSSKVCWCCHGGYMKGGMMCKHDEGCKCGDCERCK